MTLGGIYLTTVAISAIVQFINNKSACDTIRREGYIIDRSQTTASENLSYFLSDYFFLCIPIYNLWKSIITNRVKKKPHEYTAERRKIYQARELLIDPKKQKEEAAKKEAVKEVKENKEVKEVQPSQTKVQAIAPKPKKAQAVPSSYASREDELAHCKLVLHKLLVNYEDAQRKNLPYATQKELYDQIINYQTHIKSLKSMIAKDNAVARMQQERAALGVNQQKKLELK